MANLSNINNKFLVTTGGNVGIGTTSPTAKLHITEQAESNYFLKLQGTYGNGNTYGFRTNGGNSEVLSLFDVTAGDRIVVHGNTEHSFATGGTTRMIINSSGNVGIGTTSPGTVHGVSYGTTKLHIDGGTDRGQLVIEGDSLAGIAFSDNGATANQRVFYQSINGGLFNIKPLNDNGTGTASSGISMLHNGNVGIGTDSPDCKLDVRKSGTTAAQGDTVLFVGNSGSASSTSQVQIHGGTSGFSNLYFSDASAYNVGGFIYNHTDNYLATNVNGSERMRINSSGNVGINYAATGSVVDPVNSKFTVATQPPYNIANSKIEPTTATFFSDKMTNNDYNSILQLVSVRTSLTSGQNSNGYLGFSTLDNSNAQGVIDAGRIAIVNENGVARNSPTALSFWTCTPNGNVDNTPATEKMRITSGGKVGIGTDSPVNALHIKAPNGGMMRIENSSGQIGAYTEFSGGYAYQYYYELGGGVKIALQTNGNSYFNGGNVGIGTTLPRGKGLEIFRAAGLSSNPQLIISTGENSSLDYSLATDTVSAGDFCILSGVVNTSSAIKMRFQGNDVFFGTPTSTYPSTNNFVHINTQSGVSMVIGGHSGTHTSVQFRHNGATIVGSIVVTSTSTTYNTSSDYRLKEDLQDFSGLDMVSKIPVYDFKWKTETKRSYGVMAHELQEVLSDAVSGKKDAEEMQGVDYSKIVPILVKSIQELKAEIDELKK